MSFQFSSTTVSSTIMKLDHHTKEKCKELQSERATGANFQSKVLFCVNDDRP